MFSDPTATDGRCCFGVKWVKVKAMVLFPSLPLEAWADTKDTVHRFAQVVGKVRLAASVRRNHWWNVPFHLTGRGITTRPMGGNPIFTIDFDFVAHQLLVCSITGQAVSFPLAGHSVASFYQTMTQALNTLGVDVRIDHPHPFDMPDGDTPFAEDTQHRAYDPMWATRYWHVLSQINLILEEFASGFSGKISPVHHFWHTFDLAVTRFSDRRIDQPTSVDPVTREAYSREVISSGFWFGDDTFPAPAFYCYTAPEPPGLADEPLQPATARWITQRDSHLAVLAYDDARRQTDPKATALQFYESAYQAGARRAGWDTERHSCPGGVTDPAA